MGTIIRASCLQKCLFYHKGVALKKLMHTNDIAVTVVVCL